MWATHARAPPVLGYVGTSRAWAQAADMRPSFVQGGLCRVAPACPTCGFYLSKSPLPCPVWIHANQHRAMKHQKCSEDAKREKQIFHFTHNEVQYTHLPWLLVKS